MGLLSVIIFLPIILGLILLVSAGTTGIEALTKEDEERKQLLIISAVCLFFGLLSATQGIAMLLSLV